MNEQKIILNNITSFELKDVFDCGQCFRWEEQNDGSYTGVIKQGVLNVSKVGQNVCIKGMLNAPINEVVNYYFDLDYDYNKVKNDLSQIDANMKQAVEFGSGIRIICQDLWEMLISYIISANNNIPRIKKIINAISKKYGTRVEWNNQEYYLFPTVEQLAKATQQDFRDLGAGFRDKYIFKTTQMVKNKEIDLDELTKINDSSKVREILEKCQGVGDKVADCIMLFGMHRFDVFPIDVWVRRVMNDLYIHQADEKAVSKVFLQKYANQKFGDISGLAQQYLFYWRRSM